MEVGWDDFLSIYFIFVKQQMIKKISIKGSYESHSIYIYVKIIFSIEDFRTNL